jgi:hypothetical protein
VADEKQYVSMLDLKKDTEELLELNPEADANAMLPPIPAGRYLASFQFLQKNPEKRWVPGIWPKSGLNQQKVYYTGISATLYNTPEGLYDNRQVRDNLISTFIQRNTGTCSIQGLLQCIGVPLPPTCKTRAQLCGLLNETLEAGDATGEIEVEWEAAENLSEEERDVLKAAGKKSFRLQGMKRFPIDPANNTKHIPVINHLGTDYRAVNIIARYITAGANSATVVEEQAPVAAPVRRTVPQAPRAPQGERQTITANDIGKLPASIVTQANGAMQGPPVPPSAQAPRTPQGPRQVPRAPQTPTRPV